MKISKVTLLVLLPALGCFLGYWVFGQYQQEKQALKNEALLEIAQSVITDQDENLKHLIGELQQNRGGEHEGIEVNVLSPKGNSLSGLDGSFSGTVLYADSMGQLYDGEGGLVSGQKVDEGEINTRALLRTLPLIAMVGCIYLLLILSIYFLDRSHRREKQVLEARSNFISNMAHELNTPVSTIGIALEALADFHGLEDEEKTRNYLRISREQISKLSGTISQVMEVMKLEHGKAIFQPVRLDLHGLTATVVDSMKVMVDHREIRMLLESQEAPFWVEVDPEHFENAVRNVLDNAVKYSEPGGSVHISLFQREEHVELNIRDGGKGIAKSDLDRVFDRFFRSETGAVHNVKGTGLGLSYAREVVENHQGSIQVASKPGDTVFTIRLPLAHGKA